MVGGIGRRLRANVGNAQNLDQKFGKFVHLVGQLVRLIFPLWIAGEKVAVEDLQHGGARTGGDDHVLAQGKAVQYPLGKLPGQPGEAGIEEGLPAASLVFGEVHRYALPPQYPNRADAHLRV